MRIMPRVMVDRLVIKNELHERASEKVTTVWGGEVGDRDTPTHLIKSDI